MTDSFIEKIRNLRIGYVPINLDLKTAPGDYRRFVEYCRHRDIDIEIATYDEKYDLVVLSQLADITMWKDYDNGLIVYDFVDSYLGINKTNITGLLRGLAKYLSRQNKYLNLSYWNANERMCKRADAVICSTNEQEEIISKYCKNTHVILDFHDGLIKTTKSDFLISGAIKLVWEGLPSNINNLLSIRNVISDLSQKYDIEMHIITDIRYHRFLGKYSEVDSLKRLKRYFKNTNIVFHEWGKKTLNLDLISCDIALIPIDCTSSFSLGKPENKLLLLWKNRLPVVVSDTPSYRRVMIKAGIDFTCKNENEWFKKIDSLIVDHELRKKNSEAGYRYVTKFNSTYSKLKQWDSLLKSIIR